MKFILWTLALRVNYKINMMDLHLKCQFYVYEYTLFLLWLLHCSLCILYLYRVYFGLTNNLLFPSPESRW